MHATFKEQQRQHILDEKINQTIKRQDQNLLNSTNISIEQRPVTTNNIVTYRPNLTAVHWKAPQTKELIERMTLEKNRYEAPVENRRFGIKYICPPKADNILELVKEQDLYDR